MSSEKIVDFRQRAEQERAKLEASSPELIVSDKGVIKPCEHNAKVLIAGAPQYAGLHFDDFLSRMRIGARDWSDADDLEALCWLQSAHGVYSFTLGQTRNAARATAYSSRVDSLREFVMSLPAWDGTPRIALAFADAWGAPDCALTRAASTNLFIALIARALNPGAQVDTLWAIEGPQGSYKSRSLRALGREFHAEVSAPVGSADFMRELRGLWLAELSELDSLRGREASTVKRLLSAPSDRFVEKYEKHAERYQRRAVAIATTNEATYWQDSTGARRLVPITAGVIRLDLIEANRLQWFAEARQLYEAGASWWEFPQAIDAAREDRQQIDPWEDTLRNMIANGRSVDLCTIPWPDGWIASAAILKDWLRLEPHQQGHLVGRRLGYVMRRLGFSPVRQGKDRERGWQMDTYNPTDGDVSA